MAETIVLDPAAVATSRTALDITAWIAVGGVDWGDAQVEAYMADAERGQIPVDFRIPNRTVSLPLVVKTVGATSFDTFRQQLQAKVALLQREGGWLSRQTSVGTLYMDVVNATLRLGGDWLQANKGVDTGAVLTLECIPDFYGAEITLDDIVETTAAEIVTPLKLSAVNAVIKGDYPGRVRIVVDEDQAQSQLGLFWGIRSRYYSSASTAALRYEAEALTPLDSAAIATVTGASGGASNNVMRHANLATDWTPVLSTQILSGSAHMTHTGTYRVRARVYSTSAAPPTVRFLWDVGDLALPVVNTPWAIPEASNFFIADLGEIRLDPAPVGTHRWQGAIQARGLSGGENVSIDKLWLVPADEGSGTLRAPQNLTRGLASFSARDAFDQTAGALTGKTAVVGGVWAGSGDADDFAVETTGHTAQRTAVSDAGGSPVATGRWVRVGSAMTNAQVQVDFKRNVAVPASGVVLQAVFARYVDTSNYVMAYIYPGSGPSGETTLNWVVNVAGVVGVGDSNVDVVTVGDSADAWYTLRLGVDSSGRLNVWFGPQGQVSDTPIVTTRHADLATGGTLASGTCGFYDVCTGAGAVTRNYDNFAVWPPDNDAALFASQSAELRWDGMFREESSGAAYGPASWVTGDLPRIPPSGLESRPVELLIKASRGDLDRLPDSGIDDISARAFYRPSWLIVPGS